MEPSPHPWHPHQQRTTAPILSLEWMIIEWSDDNVFVASLSLHLKLCLIDKLFLFSFMATKAQRALIGLFILITSAFQAYFSNRFLIHKTSSNMITGVKNMYILMKCYPIFWYINLSTLMLSLNYHDTVYSSCQFKCTCGISISPLFIVVMKLFR